MQNAACGRGTVVSEAIFIQIPQTDCSWQIVRDKRVLFGIGRSVHRVQ